TRSFAMRARTLIVLLMIALVAVFTVLNWGVFVTPTALSLGFMSVDAPLGLVMLALLALLVLTFAIYMALWQSTVLAETRAHTKEMQAQRELADQAEASRFTELRTALQAEFATLGERLGKAQDALRQEMRDSSNSLAATIGEIEDRLQRQGGGGSGRNP
ncbi:MAG: LapA family protein, partial [Burkholderiaceae bacterium]|nr:LapA family protein [Burkholderiaceae bacterium]